MRRLAALIAPLVSILALAPGGASGFAPGSVEIPFPNGGDSLAADALGSPDGGTFVSGRLIRSDRDREDGAFVAKLNADGALDPSFGDGGLLLDLGPSKARAMATGLALDADGRLLVAGFNGSDVFVARLASDGTPDPGFDGDGVFTVPSPDSTEAAMGDGIELDADGRIAVAVRARSSEWRGFRPGVVRLLPDGGLDLGFGTNGRALVAPRLLAPYTSSRKFDVCSGCSEGGIALDADGGVLLTGRKGNDIAVIRLRAGGRIDRDFAEDGLARIGIDRRRGRRTDLEGNSLLVRRNGRLLVAGSMLNYRVRCCGRERAGFAFAGLEADGSRDRRFAAGAVRLVRTDGRFLVATDAAHAPGGGFAATGHLTAGPDNERFALALVDRRGRADRDRTPAGGRVSEGPRSGQANALVFDTEGRAVIAGFADRARQRAMLVSTDIG